MTSSDSNSMASLGAGTSDYVASALRALTGILPQGASPLGPFLVELITTSIPNQRLDRIAAFVAELGTRLSDVEKQLISTQPINAYLSDLFEEALRQAARALSCDRVSYLASLLSTGLSSDQTSHAESRRMLRLLDELTDVEVIWLRYYLECHNDDRGEAFRELHSSILTPVSAHMGSLPEEVDAEALQRSYREHLVQLGLLRPRFVVSSKTGQPEFDRRGTQKLAGYELTRLGGMLLRRIGTTSKDLGGGDELSDD